MDETLLWGWLVLEGMSYLVLGANGQLGSEIVKELRRCGLPVVPVTRADADVTDFLALENLLRTHNPSIVINTTAFHNVDLCENEERHGPGMATLLNAAVPHYLATLARSMGFRLVHLSTDYVYGADGAARTTPYAEADETGPVSAYGRSKLMGERLVLRADPTAAIVRTSGIQGIAKSSVKGSNFIELMLRLGAERGEVQVVTGQITSPTYAHDLAKQVLLIAEREEGGIFHAASHGGCSWFDYTRAIFEEAGMPDVVVEPVTSDFFPGKAPRPAYSVLDNKRLRDLGIDTMRPWRDALRAYLAERKSAQR